MHLCPTDTAARMLGLTVETLRSWRRSGIGPSYVKQPGGYVRSRSRGAVMKLPSGVTMDVFAGERHWCDSKPHGSVYYPEDKLLAYVNARLVPQGTRFLPRPFPGRLPGGKNRTAAAAEGAAAVAGTVGSDAKGAASPIQHLQLYDSAIVARHLGVLPETLRSWRRRGIGPGYVRLPGGHGGHIRYPFEEMIVFSVLYGLLVRPGQRRLHPIPGRMPGGVARG